MMARRTASEETVFAENRWTTRRNNQEKDQKQCDQDQSTEQMPDGQHLQVRHRHDPHLFKAQSRRVQNLCKWYELGIRPSLSSSSLLNLAAHHQKDDDLFASEVDHLPKLLLRGIEAQDDLNTNLPPHAVGKYEDSLKVSLSTIEDAGNGLFATTAIPKGATVCYYTGSRHHYQSQKRLKNREYILELQNGWSTFGSDEQTDRFVDPFPNMDVLARFINDSKIEGQYNVAYEHSQEPRIWHCPVVAQRDIVAGEELFVSYGHRYWAEHEKRRSQR